MKKSEGDSKSLLDSQTCVPRCILSIIRSISHVGHFLLTFPDLQYITSVCHAPTPHGLKICYRSPSRRGPACLLMKGSAANASAPATAMNTIFWLPLGAFMTPCCTADLVIGGLCLTRLIYRRTCSRLIHW